jgi:hypothetical protein
MTKINGLAATLVKLLSDPPSFPGASSGLRLRAYQVEVFKAVVDSVLAERGDTIVVMFPRQSGKNELQAQIETYLLIRMSLKDAEMVKVSPTWKPQSINAMRRLERVLKRNVLTTQRWTKEAGYIYGFGSARIFFLSGSPEANIVGATANVLLEVDEAQDVEIGKFDKDILPMAASTNATRVFWGTAWTSKTLLARELRAARAAQQRDGVQRVFLVNAEVVGQEVPAYRRFVAEQVAKLGRNHPLVKTQFFSEEIDAESGMFPARRLRRMQGEHPPAQNPQAGRTYALLLDVAGEDEAATDSLEDLRQSRRDSTALTIMEVDLSTLQEEGLKAPTYKVMQRLEWLGEKHTRLYGQIINIFHHWRAAHLVVDATGVGAGLASFLEKSLPGKVTPYVFSSKSKSDLGWQFLAVIETGRYREYRSAAEAVGGQTPSEQHELQERFWEQCAYCASTILEGPGKVMRWGVPDGTLSTERGEPVHDDLLLSAALCAALDGLEWYVSGSPAMLRAPDPLQELDQGF